MPRAFDLTNRGVRQACRAQKVALSGSAGDSARSFTA